MHSFATVASLMKAFRMISLDAPDTTSVRRGYTNSKNLKTKPAISSGIKDHLKPKVKEVTRCYHCDEVGHYARNCSTMMTTMAAAKKRKEPSERLRNKKAEVSDGTSDQQINLVDEYCQPMKADDESERSESSGENEIHLVDTHQESRDEFQRTAELQVKGGKSLSCVGRVDTGCPVTPVKEEVKCYRMWR